MASDSTVPPKAASTGARGWVTSYSVLPPGAATRRQAAFLNTSAETQRSLLTLRVRIDPFAVRCCHAGGSPTSSHV